MVMKKGLIFIGAAETGKSRTAEEIKKIYGDQVVFFDGRNFKPGTRFFYDCFTEKTKIIIIDDYNFKKYYVSLYSLVVEKIMINKKNEMPFLVELDKVIVIANSDIKIEDLPQDQSFLRRFTILEFPNVSPELLVNELFNETDKRKSILLDSLSFLPIATKNAINS